MSGTLITDLQKYIEDLEKNNLAQLETIEAHLETISRLQSDNDNLRRNVAADSASSFRDHIAIWQLQDEVRRLQLLKAGEDSSVVVEGLQNEVKALRAVSERLMLAVSKARSALNEDL